MKYGSRKFIITIIVMIISIILPPIYSKLFNLDSQVIITIEGIINALAGLYLGANAISKKYMGDSNG